MRNVEPLVQPSAHAPATAGPAVEPDNGDFVDQLRNVHYLLIIACLALLIVANSQRDTSDTERAARDMVALSNFADDWAKESFDINVYKHLITLVSFKRFSPLALAEALNVEAVANQGNTLNFELRAVRNTWMLAKRESHAEYPTILTSGDLRAPRTTAAHEQGLRAHDWNKPPSIDNLRDLKAVWNMLDEFQVLVSFSRIRKASLFTESDRLNATATFFCDGPFANTFANSAQCTNWDAARQTVMVADTSIISQKFLPIDVSALCLCFR
jgi:hypothetical protein